MKHSPEDFKIGTVFYGAQTFARCEVVNIYRKATLRKGVVRPSKRVFVSYRNTKTGKIHVTDIETLCRCNIEVEE